MKKNICYIIVSVLLTGCIYPYTADIEEGEVARDLVIDANILLGNTSYVSLTYLQPLDVGKQNYGFAGYPQATVYLEDENGQQYNATGNNGNYQLNIPETAGGKFRLTVNCNSQVYRSDWVVPVAPPEVKDISFSADEDNVYVKLSMQDNGSGSGYATVQFDEIWHFHTDFIRSYYYNEDQNSVGMLIKPDMSKYWCWMKNKSPLQKLIDYSSLGGKVDDYVFHVFSRSDGRNLDEYNVRVKVWNLTPEQYKYRKQLEENASIGGNLFSPEPGEVRGNVFCESNPDARVFGYVNISRVATLSKTLPSTYSKWHTTAILTEVDPEDWPKYYGMGYLPVEQMISQKGGTVVGWGHARCFDCVAAGGTLEKPLFDDEPVYIIGD